MKVNRKSKGPLTVEKVIGKKTEPKAAKVTKIPSVACGAISTAREIQHQGIQYHK